VSNAAKPARLWLRDVRGNKVWYIRDNGRQIATGCGAGDRAGAEEKLAAHIVARPKPSSLEGGRDPSTVAIADVLNIYLTRCCAKAYGKRKGPVARIDEVARRVETLLGFFGARPVTSLSKAFCGQYAEHRSAHPNAARRELEDLSAALGYAFSEEILDRDFRNRIVLPPKAEPRQRWLTRSEAARLLWAAWRFRQRERGGEIGRLSRQHLARFILVGLYTGTRSAAICGAAMGPAIGRGHIDLDHGVFYRNEPGKVQTSKKQTPVRLPDRLLAHIRRWKRRGVSLSSVVEYEGQPVQSVKKAFARCVADAGLEGKVSPHSLRHTAITWALQEGSSIWDVSDFFGVSQHIIQSVYGHHCPDRHADVGRRLTRRRNGS
jgi:integrase